jgi:hypothetical protein
MDRNAYPMLDAFQAAQAPSPEAISLGILRQNLG